MTDELKDATEEEKQLQEDQDVTENDDDPSLADTDEDANGETPGADEAAQDDKDASDTEDEDDSVIVSIGDESSEPDEDEKQAPAWVKEVRAQNRETSKENKALKAKLAALESANKPEELRARPSIADPDIDYDEEKLNAELDKWHEEKRADNARKQAAAQEREAEQKAFQERVNLYETGRSELRVKDYADAEADVFNALDDTRKALVVTVCDNPALVTYALGKNPAELERLSKIGNHALFVKEVLKLEQKTKVKPRKPSTQPEKLAKSAGGVANQTKTAEALLKKAGETGDFTQYTAYQRKLREGK